MGEIVQKSEEGKTEPQKEKDDSAGKGDWGSKGGLRLVSTPNGLNLGT